MPPGRNKPGRCGRRDAQRAKEPCTRRRAHRIKERYSCRTRSSRKSRSSARKGWPRFSGRRNRSDGMRRWRGNHRAHSLCAAHRRGQEPQEGTQTDTSTSVQGPDGDRRPRAMRWSERQERCAGHMRPLVVSCADLKRKTSRARQSLPRLKRTGEPIAPYARIVTVEGPRNHRSQALPRTK